MQCYPELFNSRSQFNSSFVIDSILLWQEFVHLSVMNMYPFSISLVMGKVVEKHFRPLTKLILKRYTDK